jgi:cell division protein FtsW
MYALGPQRANVMNYAYGTNYGDTYFFGKQLTSVIIAVVAFSVFYFVPYKWFTGERSKYVLWAGFLSCVLLFLLGSLLHLSFAKETNGAYRWFYLGGLGSFQPSELLKYGILLFLAGFLGRRAETVSALSVFWNSTLMWIGILPPSFCFIFSRRIEILHFDYADCEHLQFQTLVFSLGQLAQLHIQPSPAPKNNA